MIEYFAVYEKKPTHGSEEHNIILAPFASKEDAEVYRKKFGYDTDNYYVDKLKQIKQMPL